MVECTDGWCEEVTVNSFVRLAVLIPNDARIAANTVLNCGLLNAEIQLKDSSGRTAHDSHCNYQYLSENEKVERLQSLQKQKIALKDKVKKLQMKANRLIEREGVRLTEEDAADIQTVMAETSDKVEDDFVEDSFQHILWEQQRKYNALKDKRQMRWHPLVIRFEQVDNQFALIMDEMKIKRGLVFRKHTGKLVGFCDLGTVNQQMEELSAANNTECSQHPSLKLAKQMLTFRPSLSFMVASYASLGLSGEKLYAPVWEVVEALEFNGLPVLSLTSDGASPNRRFYGLCSVEDKTHMTRNPFADRDLYFFCDLPHLMKTTRNCLSNSGTHSKSRNLVVS